MWTICTYIAYTIHYVYITLHKYYFADYTHTTIIIQALAYCIWFLILSRNPNKPTNPSIAGWWYFSSKGNRFNKSIHMSTYILPIYDPMLLMVDEFILNILKIY